MAVSAGSVEIEFVTNLARIEGELSQIKRAVGQTMGEAVTQQNKVGAASNAMVAALERQVAQFGKSTAQIRSMQAAAQALAAEAQGMSQVAQRIRDADAALTSLEQKQAEAAQAARALSGQHVALATATGKSSFALRNAALQLPDITQGLLTGQKPMTIFIQQGGQIAQVAMMAEGGIKGFAKELGALALRFAPVIAVAGAAFGAFELFSSKLTDDANLKAYVGTLGLTSKELKKLGDVGLTAGDIFSGMWKTIAEAAGVDVGLSGVRKVFTATRDWIVDALRTATTWIYGAFAAAYTGTVETWRQFPAVFGDLFTQGVNKAIEAINDLSRGANSVLGKDVFGTIAPLKNQFAGAGKDVGQAYVKAFTSATKDADEFLSTMSANIISAAKQRIKAQADAISADRREAEAEKARRKALEDAAKAAREAAAAHRELMSTFDSLLGKFDPVTEALRQYSKTLDDIEKLRKGGLISERVAISWQIQAAPDLSKIADDAAAKLRAVDFGKVDIHAFDGMVDRLGTIKTSAEQITDALKDQVEHWKDLRDQMGETGRVFADAFGNVGRGITSAINSVLYYGQQQAKAAQVRQAALKLAGTDEQAQASANKQYARDMAQAQVAAYGDILDASRDFFDQNSAGYKALTKGVQTFRAIEFALSVRAMAQDLAHTAASLANSAARVAAGAVEAVVNAIKSLPFPLNLAAGAATVAALGSIGVAIAGSFGGGGAKPTAPNEGKGTVLGDSDAQSASVTRAIQALQDIDAAGLAVSRDMLASLRSIESSIGGLSSLIVRAGDVNASAGVATGFKTNALGGTLDAILTGGGLLKGVPILGDILGGIGGVVKSLFGTKTTVTGSGIYGDAQSLGNILGGGFDASYYSDVQKKKKFFGITTGTSYSTQYTNASGEIEDQFTKILSSFYQAIDAAAGPLGLATSDVEQRLNSFVVNIGKIDLQGLTGQEISDKLTAVFGAAADNMANAVVPGLSRFQKVGEGAFETLIRVASTVEAVTTSLNHLGANARDLGVDAALGLSGLFDSVSDLTSAADSYFQNFYTPEEQAAAKMADLDKVFASLNLALPDSISGYRALVDAQNLNTDAGRAAYAALLQLAPAFSDVVGSMQDATSAAAVVRERQDLERQLLQLQGDTTALRALDLSKLDASNRALQQQIWALTDQQAAAQAAAQAEQALAQQRSSMEEQLLQLQGDTAELQRRQLEALDPSLRALQQQIWAAQAAQDAAQKAQQLADAWKSVGDSILDEINRIRGLAANDIGSSLAALQQQFDAATALARGGDQDAAGKLVGLSQSLLDAASNAARDQLQLNQIQSATAASLQQTYDMIQKAVGASDAATGGSAGGFASDAAAWWAAFAANAPANSDNADVVRELVSLRQEVAQLRSDNNDGNAQIAGPLKKMGRVVDDVTGQSGGSAVAVIVEAA